MATLVGRAVKGTERDRAGCDSRIRGGDNPQARPGIRSKATLLATIVRVHIPPQRIHGLAHWRGITLSSSEDGSLAVRLYDKNDCVIASRS